MYFTKILKSVLLMENNGSGKRVSAKFKAVPGCIWIGIPERNSEYFLLVWKPFNEGYK